MPNTKPRCSALNSKGKPCNARPIQPEGLCFGHHPKANEWRKKGGRPRSQKRATLPAPMPVSELMGDSALNPLLRNMEEILTQVHREDLAPDRARAIVTVANAMMKMIDKADDHPIPDPDPARTEDGSGKWIFDDPPPWLIRDYGYAEAFLDAHEEQLESDSQYAEEWRLSEEEYQRDEEDFYYAMTKAIESLETVDRSQPPQNEVYRNAAQEAMDIAFKQAIAEREAERQQVDPIPV